MNVVNNELSSTLKLNDKLKPLLNFNSEQILNKAQKEGWLTDSEIEIVNSFSNDLKSNISFESSIENLESKKISSKTYNKLIIS